MFKPKVLLVVMDGWGYSPIKEGNAILQAKKPNYDYLWGNYAHILLNSFGENVGLPWGSIGSSEVGHSSIGSGRLVNQELSLVDKEIATKEFYKNQIIHDFIRQVQDRDGTLHFIGLVSNGGVHSHVEHLYALFKILKDVKFHKTVYVHVITDGRDTSPKSAMQYVKELQSKINQIGIDAKIATIVGRYYAMDRDSNWERTKSAYTAIVNRVGRNAKNFIEAIKRSYDENIGDEFIVPTVIDIKTSKPFFSFGKDKNSDDKSGAVQKNDGVIFFNIRPDRMRQIAEMFVFKKKEIGTEPVPNTDVLTLSTYNEYFPVKVAYPSVKIKDPLAKILSDNNITQAHFAESEKYAHATYFFNGGNPEPFPGEKWILVPSPKVATYDLKPEMSADQITDKIFEELEKREIGFIFVNYANCDLVGHSGNFNAEIKAVEAIDKQLGRLMKLLPETTIMITADHGNGECMIHPDTHEIDKKHSVNPVPFILVNEQFKRITKNEGDLLATGILADIAPTILHFFNLQKTEHMNGVDLTESMK